MKKPQFLWIQVVLALSLLAALPTPLAAQDSQVEEGVTGSTDAESSP